MDDTYRPTVDDQSDLAATWSHLMGPGGFDGRSTWMLRIDEDRRAIPMVTEITECDEAPDPAFTDGLAAVLSALHEEAPGSTFAFLVSRPGRGVHESDRMWARFVHEAGRRAGVRLEMTHLATDAGVVPLPPDELIQRSA